MDGGHILSILSEEIPEIIQKDDQYYLLYGFYGYL